MISAQFRILSGKLTSSAGLITLIFMILLTVGLAPAKGTEQRLVSAVDYLDAGKEMMKHYLYDEAHEYFRQAVKLDSMLAEAWMYLGLLNYYDHNDQMAFDGLNHAISLDEGLSDAWFYRGIAYYYDGEPLLAIRDFSRAVGLNPGKARTYYARGLARFLIYDDQVDREKLYDVILELNPDCPGAHMVIGFTRYYYEDYENAIRSFSRVIELDPMNPEAWFMRGRIKWDLNRHWQALHDINRAIRIDREHARAYFIRGHIRYDLAWKSEGCRDFRQARHYDHPGAATALQVLCR